MTRGLCCELKTVGTESQKSNPSPPNRNSISSTEVSLNWLLSCCKSKDGNDAAVTFSIDRSLATCRTPVENDDTRSALLWQSKARSFWSDVKAMLSSRTDYGPASRERLASIHSDTTMFDINSAVFSLDESSAAPGAVAGRGVLLSDGDFGTFLEHYSTRFRSFINDNSFPSATAGHLATKAEVAVYALAQCCERGLWVFLLCFHHYFTYCGISFP